MMKMSSDHLASSVQIDARQVLEAEHAAVRVYLSTFATCPTRAPTPATLLCTSCFAALQGLVLAALVFANWGSFAKFGLSKSSSMAFYSFAFLCALVGISAVAAAAVRFSPLCGRGPGLGMKWKSRSSAANVACFSLICCGATALILAPWLPFPGGGDGGVISGGSRTSRDRCLLVFALSFCGAQAVCVLAGVRDVISIALCAGRGKRGRSSGSRRSKTSPTASGNKSRASTSWTTTTRIRAANGRVEEVEVVGRTSAVRPHKKSRESVRLASDGEREGEGEQDEQGPDHAAIGEATSSSSSSTSLRVRLSSRSGGGRGHNFSRDIKQPEGSTTSTTDSVSVSSSRGSGPHSHSRKNFLPVPGDHRDRDPDATSSRRRSRTRAKRRENATPTDGDHAGASILATGPANAMREKGPWKRTPSREDGGARGRVDAVVPSCSTSRTTSANGELGLDHTTGGQASWWNDDQGEVKKKGGAGGAGAEYVFFCGKERPPTIEDMYRFPKEGEEWGPSHAQQQQGQGTSSTPTSDVEVDGEEGGAISMVEGNTSSDGDSLDEARRRHTHLHTPSDVATESPADEPIGVEEDVETPLDDEEVELRSPLLVNLSEAERAKWKLSNDRLAARRDERTILGSGRYGARTGGSSNNHSQPLPLPGILSSSPSPDRKDGYPGEQDPRRLAVFQALTGLLLASLLVFVLTCCSLGFLVLQDVKPVGASGSHVLVLLLSTLVAWPLANYAPLSLWLGVET